MGAGGASTPQAAPGTIPSPGVSTGGNPGDAPTLSTPKNALGSAIPPMVYGVDTQALGQFMNSKAGSAYAGMYDPSTSYQTLNGDTSAIYDAKGNNVTYLMTAFQAWQTGMQQTKSNWNNYSDAVSANKGGEGDNTITSGDAVGQRQQLLGALNAPPAAATSVFGATPSRLGSVK